MYVCLSLGLSVCLFVYLTTQLRYFLIGYISVELLYKQIASGKEVNVLFNDVLDTIYLRLYGVGHMIKNQLDSERENPLPSYHELLFLDINK